MQFRLQAAILSPEDETAIVHYSGTDILPVAVHGSALSGQQQIYASALRNMKTREVILKLVNTSTASMVMKINLAGVGQISKSAQSFVLASEDLKTENNLDAPNGLRRRSERFDQGGRI